MLQARAARSETALAAARQLAFDAETLHQVPINYIIIIIVYINIIYIIYNIYN
jgi:hypothetical protein